jgi:hypothetical protein
MATSSPATASDLGYDGDQCDRQAGDDNDGRGRGAAILKCALRHDVSRGGGVIGERPTSLGGGSWGTGGGIRRGDLAPTRVEDHRRAAAAPVAGKGAEGWCHRGVLGKAVCRRHGRQPDRQGNAGDEEYDNGERTPQVAVGGGAVGSVGVDERRAAAELDRQEDAGGHDYEHRDELGGPRAGRPGRPTPRRPSPCRASRRPPAPVPCGVRRRGSWAQSVSRAGPGCG